MAPVPAATHADPRDALTDRQRDLLDAWLPGHEVVRDHGWGLVETTVLELTQGERRFVLKAGGPTDTHIARELRAHRGWIAALLDRGLAPRLVAGDADARVLLTVFLPGEPVLGHPAQHDPDTYRQAGVILRALHDQTARTNDAYEARMRDRALAWLDGVHRIDADTQARLREVIGRWPTPPATVVPTHGDWQPRNWLIDGGTVRVIDFGRFDLRPAYTDLTRLAVQDFAADPALDRAFVAGYGADPRRSDPAAWQRNRIREAIGTAAWAYAVGDAGFERQGHAMIAAALADEP